MESAVDDLHSVKYKAQHLSSIANLFAEKSPELGKVYGKKFQDLLNSLSQHQEGNALDSLMCPFCGSLYLPDNHTLRIRPRMRCTKQIKRLDSKQNQEGVKLGKFKARMLNMFAQSTADMVILCLSCNRRNVIHGQSRENKTKTKQKLSLLLTPEHIAVKKKKKRKRKKSDFSLLNSTSSSLDSSLSVQMLTSTPKATLFTPARPSPKTQTSSTSSAIFASPAASSGTSSKKSKKAFHSQLKSMLIKNKGNGSTPKTSLKDFLSSL